ncbi:uncharacterized protein LOC107038618 [Diachasma alloeum]|uniref:uncharacterized protein LOC107038618 n=1 Tax=Diachasma alloeum TaxID=454923 RepID=UPI00073816C5|nr:uncharacterized protein LOC107038618 [Diachasma alloeum]
MSRFPRILVLLSCCTVIGNALECYVCDRQQDNTGKCLSTINTCEYDQDACFTEVNWGSTPYWSPAAQKQHYISKKCMSKRECEKIRKVNMPDCTYLWYQDWKCSECCQGDRCNYYIFSGASKYTSWSVLTSIAVIPLFWSWITA